MCTMWKEPSWDSVGYGATHHPTKIQRKEDGKETEKETAGEPRNVESSKEEKAETMEKEKVEEKKETTSQRNHRTAGRTVDKWISGTMLRTILKTQKPTLRVGGTMIGTQQIRILKPEWQLKNFNMRLSVICDSRSWVLSKHIESFQHEWDTPHIWY